MITARTLTTISYVSLALVLTGCANETPPDPQQSPAVPASNPHNR